MNEPSLDPERSPIGPVTSREDALAQLGEVASGEAAPLPAVLSLETSRAGGETLLIRNRYNELRQKVEDEGEASLTLEEYCQLQVLRDLFTTGRVSTSLTGVSAPKRYLPKRETGEGRGSFADKQVAARERLLAAYTDAFRFIMRPGVSPEAAAEVQADVERRREVLDRELRAVGKPVPADTPPAGPTDDPAEDSS